MQAQNNSTIYISVVSVTELSRCQKRNNKEERSAGDGRWYPRPDTEIRLSRHVILISHDITLFTLLSQDSLPYSVFTWSL